MPEITADILQRITLITPETSKEMIQELKTMLKNEEFEYLDYKKLWKALFYAMWHCDKFFNQQILAELISQILRVFYSQSKINSLQLYVKAMLGLLENKQILDDVQAHIGGNNETLQTLLMEININNQPKLNLSRDTFLEHFEWFKIFVILGEGLCLHFIQIYLDCLSKHTNLLNQENVDILLDPFLNLLKSGDRKTLKDKALEYVFKVLPNFKLGTFLISEYSQKVQIILQSVEVILPANKKMLNEIIKALSNQVAEENDINKTIIPNNQLMNNNKIAQNGNHNEDQDNQIEMIQTTKQIKKKKKAKILEEQEQENESISMVTKLDEVQLKKKKINEKSQQKQTQILKNVENQMENLQAGDIELEGLDYSEVIHNQDKMKLLRDIMNTIPPYLFLSPAEKKKYFGNISKSYGDKMIKEKGHQCSHKRTVKFELKNNQIREFKKTESALRVSQTSNNKRVKAM